MTQTVNDRTVTVVATSNGQTVFAYDFQAFAASHISAIFEDVSAGTTQDLLAETDFSVQGVGNANGGTITLLTLGPSVSTGDRITIFGSVPIDRTADYQQSGDFRAETVNREEDTQIQIMQELARDVDRSLKVALGQTAGTVTPGADETIAVWRGNNLVQGPTTPDLQSLADEAAASAAVAAARAGTATNQANIATQQAGVATQQAVIATDAAASISPHASRSALVSANIPAAVVAVAHVTPSGHVLRFQRDPAGTALQTNGGTVNWSPLDYVTPNHWAENANEGVTNMLSAGQNAVDYVEAQGGGIVQFLNEVYLFNGTLRPDANGVYLRGMGANATVLRQGSANTNLIRYSRSDDGSVYYRFGGVFDMTLDNLNSDETSGALLRLERARDFYVERCRLLGGFTGIENLSGNTVWIKDTLINYQSFTSSPSGDSAGIVVGRMETTASDPNGVQDPTDSLYYAIGFVCLIDNVEVWGGGDYGRAHGLLIDQCDGLQVTNSHFGRAEVSQVTIQAKQQNLILQNLNFANCQFDPAGEVLTAGSDYGVRVQADGLAARILRDVNFSNCSVLGADEDGLAVEEAVQNFSWIGGNIKLCDKWSARITAGSNVALIGLISRDANQASGGEGHVFVSSTGPTSLIGVQGDGSAGANRAFEITSAANCSMVGCYADGVASTIAPAGLNEILGGAQTIYGDLAMRDGDPRIRFVETDNADENFEMALNNGNMIINELTDALGFVSTPFRLFGGAATNSLCVRVGSGGNARIGINQNAASYELDVAGDINATSGNVFRVGGTQVVGARGAAISDPSGGATVDTQARTAINALIDRLQAHGLIS